MNLNAFSQALVIGLGKSGMATVRFLRRHHMTVCASDTGDRSAIAPEILAELDRLGVQLETGGHTDRFVTKNALIVPSPGVPLDLPLFALAGERGCTIAGEFALAAGRIDAPVIAVTGTNGKTTVTKLIGELLRAGGKKVFVGGNIGTPVLDYLMGTEKADFVVLEVSSFQLDLAGSFRPDIGLFLNISPDHLDRHGSMDAYLRAKLQIFANQTKQDTAILPGDDPQLRRFRPATRAAVLHFGSGSECEAMISADDVAPGVTIDPAGIAETFPLTQTSLVSHVNRLNSAAAVLAARLCGIPAEAVQRGLQSFHPPAHRMEIVRELDGVVYIDDSKATNIGAVEAALQCCDQPVILIAGGRNKGSDFSLLRDIVEKKVRHLVLIGESARAMAAALGSGGNTLFAQSMEQAVASAAALAQPGDIVLLAPGCASFDMFSGYAARGEAFRRAALALVPKSSMTETDPCVLS